ncbi:DUF7344 domain-containing protein (plasmid) [Haloarcula salina]|uniref:DUF7344 domain-containing protein n=1 Tax=Haloarcula salina TaxID=1429914 RepID=UPI003C6FDCEF
MRENAIPTTNEKEVLEEKISNHLHALRAPRRRLAIHLLAGRGSASQTSTRWLARRIASQENNLDPGLVSGKRYKNVYNALSQSHLPTLSGAEIIVYDPHRQEVHLGPSFELAHFLLNLNEPAIEMFYD